ncbi:MAG: hypothetical protein ACREAA_00500 [Candidatus Polarisedimenticolia bacterium]
MISRRAFAAQAVGPFLLWALAAASGQDAPKTPIEIIAEKQEALGFVQPKPVAPTTLIPPAPSMSGRESRGRPF